MPSDITIRSFPKQIKYLRNLDGHFHETNLDLLT
jgi:hypothetical protein